MVRTLRFVTGNDGKLREAAGALHGLATIEQDREGYVEVQSDSLEEVARCGLDDVARRLDPPFFLEDSGLFVSALDGFPGVYSAFVYRKLGCKGLLRLLEGVPDDARTAHFASVVAYRDEAGADHVFHGRADGWIRSSETGGKGFGYDPVFSVEAPQGASFGSLDPSAKNEVSHRGRALRALRGHLEREGREKDS